MQSLSQSSWLEKKDHDPAIQSPTAFLGYALGDRFTPHSRLVEYLVYLASHSDRVELHRYGETYEHRPLYVLYISSPPNLRNREAIQAAQQAMRVASAPFPDSAFASLPVVSWLSFGVHGNESSSAEAAMQVAWQLAAGTDSLTRAILTNSFVIIDPLLNPDGRDRYVHWFQSATGSVPNADPQSFEHDEPWPGGRTNHYYFDLNRDWAWQTQQETRARLQVYRQWYPELHVDFHEMGYNSNYFFFPAAGPILVNIPKEIASWTKIYGEAVAREFDQYGWAYYSGEDYDMFYPGYGDSWPTLNGSIGMTYEQAGGGGAGAQIRREDGLVLTLKDRLQHHYVAAMATLEATAARREARLRDFRRFWEETYKTARQKDIDGYVLLPGASREKFEACLRTLQAQEIEVRALQREVEPALARDLIAGTQKKTRLPRGAAFIPLLQKETLLLQVLFEPRPAISDTFFYDITSWSFPAAFGVTCYEVKLKSADLRALQAFAYSEVGPPNQPRPQYAYLIRWDDAATAGFISDLFEKDVYCYVAKKPFSLGARRFERGTIIVPLGANRKIAALPALMDSLAARWGVAWEGANSGLTSDGIDLGSRNVAWLRPLKIGVLGGEPISSTSLGTLWFLLDQMVQVPFSTLPVSQFAGFDLDKYNVLVFPESFGGYSRQIDSVAVQKLRRWISAGGVAIGLGQGANFFVEAKLSSNKIKKPEKAADDSTKKKQAGEVLARARRSWEQKQVERMKDRVPGAILSMQVDTTHPLGYAQSQEVYVLKRSKLVFELADKVHNAGIFQEHAYRAGYVNDKNKSFFDASAAITVEPLGEGKVILFAEDPNFRMFWRTTISLFLNALVFGSIM